MSISKLRPLQTTLTIICAIGLLWTYFRGLSSIPLHPDEVTFIYTSQDIETLFSDPLSLAWEPGAEKENRTRLRLLDEPVSRLIFGIVRQVMGLSVSEIPNDWDWTLSWEENQKRGALPGTKILTTARATISFFSVAAGVLLYFVVRKKSSTQAALFVVVMFSLNALTILHGRRAMREGLMLFAISLFIWSLLWASKKPWAAGFTAAFMLCTRYSTAPLVLVAFLAATWEPLIERNLKAFGRNSAAFGASFVMLFLFLQPVLWKHPVQGLQEMIKARVEFTVKGVSTAEALAPEVVVRSTAEKFAGVVYQVYLGPTAYYEFANYEKALADQIQAYDSQPLNQIWRGPALGSVFLFLTIAGIFLTGYRAVRQPAAPRRFLALIGLALFLETAFILTTIPFPFQRYYLPLLPFLCVISGLVFVNWEKHQSNSVK